jgi:hypothetical protein
MLSAVIKLQSELYPNQWWDIKTKGMKPTDFAKSLTDFLSKYLPGKRGMSTNTIHSYKTTFILFIGLTKYFPVTILMDKRFRRTGGAGSIQYVLTLFEATLSNQFTYRC